MAKVHCMSKVFKVLFCCGSRPELIKISPAYHLLLSIKEIRPLLCNTGQQKDLLAPHLEFLNMRPDYTLDVMRDGQSLDQLMEQLFHQLPHVLNEIRPGMIIIQGDTASALAATIIANKNNIPVAHIEAGLRTYDKKSPFPEEIYRQNISKLAHWHFCPTERARHNLIHEGILDDKIFITGNSSVDMVENIYKALPKDVKASPSIRTNSTRSYFLVTLHRRESQGSPLKEIISSLLAFTKSTPDYDFIIPLHPNPLTSLLIKNTLKEQDNIYLIPPCPYPEFVRLMADAYAIITDSGGIQEEAPSLNTPVIVVRDKTERQEGVENGCLRLAGTKKTTILEELNLLINDKTHYQRMQQAPNPFGDGRAAEKITAHLIDIVEKTYANPK